MSYRSRANTQRAASAERDGGVTLDARRSMNGHRVSRLAPEEWSAYPRDQDLKPSRRGSRRARHTVLTGVKDSRRNGTRFGDTIGPNPRAAAAPTGVTKTVGGNVCDVQSSTVGEHFPTPGIVRSIVSPVELPLDSLWRFEAS